MKTNLNNIRTLLVPLAGGLFFVSGVGCGNGSLAIPGGNGRPPVGGGEMHRLEVVNGYGSGVYEVGEMVHVWSSVSTADEVALPWRGDAALLAEPSEWHTSFPMPGRDVTVVAEKKNQAVTLTVEQYLGSTRVPKTVRYYLPSGMRGVVVFSHGTGGSSSFIESPEAFALALALVERGYGVLGTEAEEAVAGDLNGDDKERWVTRFTSDNVDLKNLQILFDDLEQRGLISSETPKFALGMSAGGAFSHFLGTVGATGIARNFPQLRFNAVVAYCADATGSDSAKVSTTPSAWFMCGNEDNPYVKNDEARANAKALSDRGIAVDYLEHPPSPLYDERFVRIPGISPETSKMMADELRAAGFVDAYGFLNTDADEIGQMVVNDPDAFPIILAQADVLGSIRAQMKVMRAEHAMYADYTQRNVAWFEQFTSNTRAGGDLGEQPSFAALEALLKSKVADGSINGYAAQIYDGDDTLLFESEAGVCKSGQYACPAGNQPFTVDLVTGVASSSKWVTSTVLLAALDELVEAEVIPTVGDGLDTTVGAVLGRACGMNRIGRGAQVTLRQLLSFTSGLLPDHPCVGDNAYDMQACACGILADSATREVTGPNDGTSQSVQPPGTVFKYGPAQQVVAAAMVEVSTGQSYAELFERLVRRPTGMSQTFYQNPTEISGSMRSSVRDYARFVRGVFHSEAPGTLLSKEALFEQERNQFPEDVVRRSQLQPGLDYGLNTWRWCYRHTDAATLLAFGQDPNAFTQEEALALQDSSCTEVHQQGHGGKGGYQPFVDRPRGFYGVFAMRESSPGGGDEYSVSELSLTATVRLYAGLVVEAMRGE